MSKRYSIAEARHNLAAIVHELDAASPVELTRRGEPVAVLLSTAAYQRLLTTPASFWAAYSAFRTDVSPDELAGQDDPFDDVRDSSTGRQVAL